MYYRVLGPLAIEDHGEALLLGGAKQRTLLAVLLLHANEVVPRDLLIESVRGQQGRPGSVHTLEVQISRLRKVLHRGNRAPLVTRATGYELRVAPDELDLTRFEELIEDGSHALRSNAPAEAASKLREALALWRGRPFEDVSYETFAQVEIQRLEHRRLEALEERLEADLALGRHADVVAELEAILNENPLDERLTEQLMLALYRCGRQAEALATYHETRRQLVEIGIEPRRTLRCLQQAILRQDPLLDIVTTSDAAADQTPAVGDSASLPRMVVLGLLLVGLGALGAGASRRV